MVSLGVSAVADALGLSLGVAVGLLEGVSLGLSEWVLGRDIVLADEAVSDGARVVVSLGVPAVADALGLSLGVVVGLLEGVSLGLSEWVLGRRHRPGRRGSVRRGKGRGLTRRFSSRRRTRALTRRRGRAA